MAAAAALVGKLADVRDLAKENAAPKKATQSLELDPIIDEVDSDEDVDRLFDLPEDDSTGTGKDSAAASGGQTPFTTVKGIAAPLDRSNVDTDAIIPKQFLKTIKRTGLGTALFYEMRYNEDGSEISGFVLNQEPYRHSKILVVTGANFGCGSSREHAPWALLDFGITCIIAPSYAEIFFNNTFKNGISSSRSKPFINNISNTNISVMLPFTIPDQATLEKVANEARAGREVEVDLVNQRVNDASGTKLADFEVEEFRKHCLINGLDDIGLTMQKADKIKKFERQRSIDTPWLDGSGYMRRGQPNGPTKIEAAPVPTTNRGEEIKEPLEW